MPRLREIGRDEVTDTIVKFVYDRKFGDQDPLDKPRTATGAPGNWETVFAQAPEVLEHIMRGFELWQSPKLSIYPLLRELAITRIGWVCQCQFVFSQHCKALRRFGGSEEQVAAISSWEISGGFSDLQRAVLAYADSLA